MLDDGPWTGNGTQADNLDAEAVPNEYVGENPETGKRNGVLTVNNVAPELDDESVEVDFNFNQYGAQFDIITVSGEFTDPGSNDVHLVTVTFDTTTSKTIELEVGSRQFSVEFMNEELSYEGDPEINLQKFFPVSISVSDDDTGTDNLQKQGPDCSVRTIGQWIPLPDRSWRVRQPLGGRITGGDA